MKISAKFLLPILIVFAATIAAAQDKCPRLSVSGPAGLIYRGDPTIFALSPDLNFSGLKFRWTVSSGTIVSGQGTPVIEVDSDLNSSVDSITATVEVSGLPEGCKNLASEVAGIKFPGDPVMFDEYDGSLSVKDELGRLDLIAAEWKNEPSHYFYFIVYRGPKDTVSSETARIKRIRDRLTVKRRMPAKNIVIISGGVGMRRSTQVYKVPPGADKPTP